ncbi:MAG: DUF3035 domain-containing protein [Alphaproteobacteria bacterium]|nr:MAG: DUF3035 domain-containing protein [Alphaproteobacteria bacterium]
MMTPFRLMLMASAATVLLSGCSSVRDTLGLTRKPPDEFSVVERAPLSLPPDFALRPPRLGAPRPQESNPGEDARRAVLGSAPTAPASASAAERQLLEGAATKDSDPNIREQIDREAAQTAQGNKKLVDDILFWRGPRETPAAVVDAPAEAQRLKGNAESKAPADKGATPIIERGKSGWLGF